MSRRGRGPCPGSASLIAVARQRNERPQLGKVLTPIVKIREAIPPQEGFAGAIPFAPHGPAKSRPQLGIVLSILMATNLPAPLVGNGIGQIPLGRIAFDCMMATDEIEPPTRQQLPRRSLKRPFIQRSP